MSNGESNTRAPNERDPLLVEGPPPLNTIEEGVSSSFTDEDDNGLQEEEGAIQHLLNSITDAATDVVESIQEAAEEMMESVQEAAGDAKEAVEEAAEEMRENIVEEAMDVKETFLDDLHEADDGEGFLDMALTRAMSILPSDIKEIADHATEEHVPTQLTTIDEKGKVEVEDLKAAVETEASTGTHVRAYLLLASAVLALSSIGPMLDLQDGCTGPMKVVWRQLGTATILSPFAALDIYRHGVRQLTTTQWGTFLLAAVSYATMCIGFVLSLSYTSIGNAVILSNSQAIILLLGKFFVGDRISSLEGSGALVAFSGAILCSKDSAEGSPSGSNAILGDALALLSGFGGVGYLVFAKTVRSHMTLYTFMFLIMLTGPILIVMFQLLVLREKVSFDMNLSHGVWGYLNLQMDRLPLELAMVVLCNMCGTLGYVRAMQHFDNLVISVAALMEPVVAEFTAFVFGVGFLPGWKGWVGNALVAFGTLAVVWPTKGKTSKSTH